MKIYFAGSIRGGRGHAERYGELIAYISKQAEVLTEHISDANLSESGEKNLTDVQIYQRDMDWLYSADAIIAEVTQPSLGVGYEIAMAESAQKPTLCLFHAGGDYQLSAMLSGNRTLKIKNYAGLAQAKQAIDAFIQSH